MFEPCSIEKLLIKSKVEATPHRAIVLKILSDFSRAVTPKDILEKIRKKESMDKVTLYRILDLFVKKGVIRRLINGQGTMCYEIICAEHNPLHAHFVCRECGDIACLHDIDLRNIKNRIKSSYREEDIDLKIEGVCVNCGKNN
ncbi:MAG: hypothetical protein A2Z88_09225 [Omnitrophica WOR_2 bacterium GWA2_47_8]|nr:MAG: hypothetical protein A2Z88_09225 [Omnitrophica WOR_2 bacterium GWA2_47_8]